MRRAPQRPWWTVGAVPPAEAPETLGDALKKITPALLLAGAAGGFAFAIGSELAHRFVFRNKR